MILVFHSFISGDIENQSRLHDACATMIDNYWEVAAVYMCNDI